MLSFTFFFPFKNGGKNLAVDIYVFSIQLFKIFFFDFAIVPLILIFNLFFFAYLLEIFKLAFYTLCIRINIWCTDQNQ